MSRLDPISGAGLFGISSWFAWKPTPSWVEARFGGPFRWRISPPRHRLLLVPQAAGERGFIGSVLVFVSGACPWRGRSGGAVVAPVGQHSRPRESGAPCGNLAIQPEPMSGARSNL